MPGYCQPLSQTNHLYKISIPSPNPPTAYPAESMPKLIFTVDAALVLIAAGAEVVPLAVAGLPSRPGYSPPMCTLR